MEKWAVELTSITKLIENKDSLLLIGPPGIGKSDLLTNLISTDTRQKYLKKINDRLLLIRINTEELAEISALEFYRYTVKRFLEIINNSTFPLKINEDGEKLLNIKDALLLIEKIKSIITILVQDNWQLLIIIDGFDCIGENLDNVFFSNLKSFRDIGKFNVSYLLTANTDPSKESYFEKIYSLYKLVSPFIFYLKPSRIDESLSEIETHSKQRKIKLTKEESLYIANLCGRYPSLVKTFIQKLTSSERKPLEITVEELLENSGIKFRIIEIFQTLANAEREIMLKIANKETVDKNSEAYQLLIMKGLIENEKIFSPLFERFLILHNTENKGTIEKTENNINSEHSIFIDPLTRLAYRNGHEIVDLTKQEYRFLQYLYTNSGKICEREEVSDAVWGGSEGVSDEAIDQVMTRLRSKLEKDKSNPAHLITIRGRGFTFKP